MGKTSNHNYFGKIYQRLDLWRKNKGWGVGFFAVAGALIFVSGVGGILAMNGFFGGGAAIPEDTMTRGLVGYWPMDEATGTVAYDASGNGNNGTLINGPKWTTGKNAGALQFDGKDDYVDCGNGTSLRITDALTVEAWIKTSYRGFQYQFVFSKGDGSHVGYEMFLNNGVLEFNGFYNNSGNFYFTGGGDLRDGQWHHVVGTYDKNTTLAKIYIDGVYKTQAAQAEGITDSGSIFRIGSRDVWAVFNGSLDDVRVYNRALTAAEVKYHYNQGGPVGYWKFDEGSGTVAKDETENNNDGTISGATWVSGKYGNALNFDGINGAVNLGVGAGTLDQISNNFTVSAWIKTPTPSARMTIFSTGYSGTGPMFGTSGNTPGGLEIYYPGIFVAYTAGGLLSPDTWYYVTYSRNGTGAGTHSFYINGVKQALVQDGASDFAASSTTKYIGYRPGVIFNGVIDETRIYSYARTADEIRLDYQAGMAAHLGPSGKTCAQDPASCMNQGLVGYWDMEEAGGLTAFDKSGNGNNGTLTNGPTWTQGTPMTEGKSALQFDGKDDYVNCGSSSSLNLTNAVTVAAWVKTNTTSGDRFIMTKWSGFSLESFRSWAPNGSFNIIVDGAQRVISFNTDHKDGKWHYLVASYDSATHVVNLYFDGKLDNTSTLSGLSSYAIQTSDNPLNIGTWGGGYFKGSIDDARVYNRALSPEEVRYHYNQGGPVGYWKFDEGSGPVAKDASANNNDATIYGATWVSGKYGSALNFDGTTSYVDLSNSSSLTPGLNSWSVGGWVFARDYTYPKTRFPIGGYNTAGSGLPNWYIDASYYSSGENIGFSDGIHRVIGALNCDAGYQPGDTINKWTYIFVVFDRVAGKVYEYVNGVKQTNTVDISSVTGSVTNPYNYISGVAGWKLDGMVDDVRIYNYARTADDIRKDYQAGVATHLGPSGKTCAQDPASCMNQGLVGYWDMEEAGGLTAFDKSGNGNNGTLTNGPTWTQGAPMTEGKSALSFDGKNDYVNTPNSQSFNAVTVIEWVKFKDAKERVAFCKGRYPEDVYDANHQAFGIKSYNNHVNAGVYASGGQAVWYIDPQTYIISDLSSVLNQWVQVAFTWDGATGLLTTYKNGVQVAQKTGIMGTVNNDASYPIKIGARGTNDQPYNGSIDDVQIYNRALSPEEVRYHYNQGGPVGWWKMDEGRGNKANDETSNNNDGTLGDGTCQPGSGTCPTWVSGKYGSALSFDGNSSYVNCGNGNSLNITGDITIGAWIYPNQLNNINAIFSKGTSGYDYSFYLGTGSYYGNALSFQLRAVGGISTGSILVQPNQWNYVTGVRNGTVMSTYINGKLASQISNAASSNIPTNSVNALIGEYTGGTTFNGSIDDVRIYNYARTADQIRVDYNDGLATHLK